VLPGLRTRVARTQNRFEFETTLSSLIRFEDFERLLQSQLAQARREISNSTLERGFSRKLPEPLGKGQQVVSIGDIHGELLGFLTTLLGVSLLNERQHVHRPLI